MNGTPKKKKSPKYDITECAQLLNVKCKIKLKIPYAQGDLRHKQSQCVTKKQTLLLTLNLFLLFQSISLSLSIQTPTYVEGSPATLFTFYLN